MRYVCDVRNTSLKITMKNNELQMRKLTITERKQHIKYIYVLVVANLNEKESFEKYYEGYNYETFYITKENTILSTSDF